MEEGKIVIWVDHCRKLISCVKLTEGILYRFTCYDALYAFCEPLLQKRYRIQ